MGNWICGWTNRWTCIRISDIDIFLFGVGLGIIITVLVFIQLIRNKKEIKI